MWESAQSVSFLEIRVLGNKPSDIRADRHCQSRSTYSRRSMARRVLESWKFVEKRVWEPLRINHSTRLGRKWRLFREIILVRWVYSLESHQWIDANEYTQYTISWWNKKISLNICFLRNWKNFLGTQKRVRISHGKWTIGVRAIEVQLESEPFYIILLIFLARFKFVIFENGSKPGNLYIHIFF